MVSPLTQAAAQRYPPASRTCGTASTALLEWAQELLAPVRSTEIPPSTLNLESDGGPLPKAFHGPVLPSPAKTDWTMALWGLLSSILLSFVPRRKLEPGDHERIWQRRLLLSIAAKCSGYWWAEILVSRVEWGSPDQQLRWRESADASGSEGEFYRHLETEGLGWNSTSGGKRLSWILGWSPTAEI